MCLGTNMCGHKRVWAQSCLGTIVSGHNRVWAQSCLGTIVWAQVCMGTIVWSPFQPTYIMTLGVKFMGNVLKRLHRKKLHHPACITQILQIKLHFLHSQIFYLFPTFICYTFSFNISCNKHQLL